MRVRDLLKFGQNLLSAMTFEWGLDGWPRLTINGATLWNIHQNSMLVQQAVSHGFNGHRIYWLNWPHELRFKPFSEHRPTLIGSAKHAEADLRQLVSKVQGSSGEDRWTAEVLTHLADRTNLAQRQLQEVLTLREYNKTAVNTFSSPDATEKDETEWLLDVIKNLRVDTLPAWRAFIDFLPEGPIQAAAIANCDMGILSLSVPVSESAGLEPVSELAR